MIEGLLGSIISTYKIIIIIIIRIHDISIINTTVLMIDVVLYVLIMGGPCYGTIESVRACI